MMTTHKNWAHSPFAYWLVYGMASKREREPTKLNRMNLGITKNISKWTNKRETKGESKRTHTLNSFVVANTIHHIIALQLRRQNDDEENPMAFHICGEFILACIRAFELRKSPWWENESRRRRVGENNGLAGVWKQNTQSEKGRGRGGVK